MPVQPSPRQHLGSPGRSQRATLPPNYSPGHAAAMRGRGTRACAVLDRIRPSSADAAGYQASASSRPLLDASAISFECNAMLCSTYREWRSQVPMLSLKAKGFKAMRCEDDLEDGPQKVILQAIWPSLVPSPLYARLA
jgi:hypothetical protein